MLKGWKPLAFAGVFGPRLFTLLNQVNAGNTARFFSSSSTPARTYTSYGDFHFLAMVGGIAVRAFTEKYLDEDKKPENMLVCSAPNWVQSIHDDWSAQLWGQPLDYLPPTLRKRNIYLDTEKGD